MSQRILIIRLSAIGDSILNIPILCALRRHFPAATIGWVSESAAAQLLRQHTYLDEHFELTKATTKSLRKYIEFGRRLRNWKPDVVIDAQGLTKSSLLGWLSGAPQRIGFTTSEFEGRELSTWFNNLLVTPKSKHVVQRGLELLRPLGVAETQIEYVMPTNSECDAHVRSFLSQLGLNGSFAVINVGAGWPSKLWPAARYAAVARHLLDIHHLRTVIVWSGPSEFEIAKEVALLSKQAACLAPTTSLIELASLIKLSSVFVGSDTGPMHLSVALGTPTVGLIGPMPIDRVGPLGANHAGIQREVLSETDRRHRKVDCGPMLSIGSDDILFACDQILSRTRSESSAAA